MRITEDAGLWTTLDIEQRQLIENVVTHQSMIEQLASLAIAQKDLTLGSLMSVAT